MAVHVSLERFEELVADALDSLPEPFASHLDNVQVVVEDWPSPEQIGGLVGGGMLLGLYEGVPQTKRGPGYTFVLPDKITIFREPIMRHSDDEDDLTEQVKHTVIHEIAHHFGISDDRLRELGAY
jgi:predicted Zn-dependent protease with MMP-like domain